MLKIKTILSVSLTLFLGMILTGCMMKQTTKIAEFPEIYRESPTSILILPPVNKSTDADATNYYSTTIPSPLLLLGYYVFPYELTSEILKQELTSEILKQGGIYDSELLRKIPLDRFFNYFGADAVLFTTINKWDFSYAKLASSLTVSIDCKIKSTHTSKTLWSYNGKVVVALGGGNGGSNLTDLPSQAIATAAQTVTRRAMLALPYGRYHELYHQDMEQKIVDQTPEKKAAQ